MNRLIEDTFVRRLAEGALLLVGFLIFAIGMCFVIITIGAYLGRFSIDDNFVYVFMHFMQFTYQNEISPFLTALVGVFPATVAAVCYVRSLNDSPPKSSDKLNVVGHCFIVIMAFCWLISAVAVVLTQAMHGTLNNLVPLKDNSPKVLFTAFLAFSSIYLAQLLGLKK